MITQMINKTADFNASPTVNLDVSGWDYVVVQIVTPSGTITFNTTNDPGDVQGVSDGNALSATNWGTVSLTNVSTGSGSTTAATSGMFRGNVFGRFLQLTASAGTTVVKLIILLAQVGP